MLPWLSLVRHFSLELWRSRCGFNASCPLKSPACKPLATNAPARLLRRRSACLAEVHVALNSTRARILPIVNHHPSSLWSFSPSRPALPPLTSAKLFYTSFLRTPVLHLASAPPSSSGTHSPPSLATNRPSQPPRCLWQDPNTACRPFPPLSRSFPSRQSTANLCQTGESTPSPPKDVSSRSNTPSRPSSSAPRPSASPPRRA